MPLFSAIVIHDERDRLSDGTTFGCAALILLRRAVERAGGSFCDILAGDGERERRKRLAEADLWIVLATATTMADPFIWDVVEHGASLHATGQVYCLFVKAGACMIPDEATRLLPIVPVDGRGYVFTTPGSDGQRLREELLSAVMSAVGKVLQMLVCPDSSENERRAYHDLRRLDRERALQAGAGSETSIDAQIAVREEELRAGGRFHLGASVVDRRYLLVGRWDSSAVNDAEIFVAHDRWANGLVHVHSFSSVGDAARNEIDGLHRLHLAWRTHEANPRIGKPPGAAAPWVEPFRFDDVRPYFVSEHGNGVPLRHAIRHRKVTWPSCAWSLHNVLELVTEAHASGLILGPVDAQHVEFHSPSAAGGWQGVARTLLKLCPPLLRGEALPNVHPGAGSQRWFASQIAGWARLVVMCAAGNPCPASLDDAVTGLVSEGRWPRILGDLIAGCMGANAITMEAARETSDTFRRVLQAIDLTDPLFDGYRVRKEGETSWSS